MTGRPEHLVTVAGLTKHFGQRRSALAIRAVDDVSFHIDRREVIGLVGESGSGKSTIGRLLMRLLEPTSGSICVDGTEITRLRGAALRPHRRRMQMVFQDPLASLNPRLTLGSTVEESLLAAGVDRGGRAARVRELFDLVGLPQRLIDHRPSQASGGQRQRVSIARALATSPELLVADEAISALDVSIQAQIVNLLRDLNRDLGLSVLFISHDLSMVRHLSTRVAVLYLGRIVELGGTAEINLRPLHPYTQALMSAAPIPDPERELARHRIVLRGESPDPAQPPPGCHFHERCPVAVDRCTVESPALRNLGTEQKVHLVACHLAESTQIGSTSTLGS